MQICFVRDGTLLCYLRAADPPDILEVMSPAPKKRSRKKKNSAGWLAWWPLILGILVTPFAVRAAGILALTGPTALRMLYPFALLPAEHALGLRDSLADTASQAMMYLQFPLYGLLAMLLQRWKSIGFALLVIAGLHLAGVGALWVLASLAK
ncbi:MAG TPA: hypothetical protein VM554_06235 [Acidisarcina sp.]|nr:hypothetical protein [Acidisarcina sp.]